MRTCPPSRSTCLLITFLKIDLTSFIVNVFSAIDVTKDVTKDVTQGHTKGKELDLWIEEQIRKDPKITTEELAKMSGFTSRTIKRHLIKLSHIKYIGSGYSGHWEIGE